MSDRNRLRRRLEKSLRTDADLDAFCLDFFPDVIRRFTDGMEHRAKVNLLLKLADLDEVSASLEKYTTGENPAQEPTSPRVSIGRLPTSVSALIGRDKELTQFDASWNSSLCRVVAIVAVGGQGKTTLAVNWLLRMAESGYLGARRVFGWSFYSQSASNERALSADEFIAAALRFFGDPTPAHGNPFEKANRLAALVRKERSLLILDGLEPLQHAPGASQAEGTLKDKALASLLRDLALKNSGLTIVTSRIKLTDLELFEGKFMRTIELAPLSEVEGVALLKSLQVIGVHEDLSATVRDYHGHPLALTLLGNLLREGFFGDVYKRAEVGPLHLDDVKGGQARRAMAAYDHWFGLGPQRAVLRLLGLFDRPAPGDALRALRGAPAVSGLNDVLVTLEEAQWSRVLERLRRTGLVAPLNQTTPSSVDAHPLIREYFGEVLKQENEAAWREGHARLYAWYGASAKERPETAEEMAPLYAAVWHGCRAGLHREAFDDVFWPRIRRFRDNYSIRMLGAFGSDLSALSGFFVTPWTKPVPGLGEGNCALVLGAVGYVLRAMGRLEEAVAPMRASIEARRAQQAWKNAAIGAGNLIQLLLGLGHVEEATATAQQAVEMADRSRDAFLSLTNRTLMADALQQGGQKEEAQRLFFETEAMQRKREPEHPFLYGLQGYQYCDLLLEDGATESVLHRAAQTLEWAKRYSGFRDIGLDHLSLGRAYSARHAAGHRAAAALAVEHLNQAVDRLRESGDQQYLPLGLLHRAAWYRQTDDYASAGRDLEEGLLLTKRGHVRLYESDFHLERARLLQAEKRSWEASAELEQARSLIKQTGYVRRVAEVKRLADELGGANSARAKAFR